MRNPIDVRILSIALALQFMIAGAAFGAQNLKTVCDVGCTHTSLQAAIDAVPDNATVPWTIFVGAGVWTSDTAIDIDAKDNLTITGYGDEASIIQATSTYFTNATASTPTTAEEFVTISDSHNIVIREIQIDATTNAPSTLPVDSLGGGLAGVFIDGGTGSAAAMGPFRFEDCTIKGFQWGLTDDNLADSTKIEVYGSRIWADYTSTWARSGNWLVWSSDLRADSRLTDTATDTAIGLYLSEEYHRFTLWGSHVHAESHETGTVGTVAGLWESANTTTDDELVAIGTTFHAKMAAIPTTGPGVVVAVRADGDSDLLFVGSDLLYEAPAEDGGSTLSSGSVGGILSGGSPDGVVSLTGVAFVNRAVDGTAVAGATQADVYTTPGSKDIRFAGSSPASTSGNRSNAKSTDTMEMQSGTDTFQTSDTLTITLPVALPNNKYKVALSVDANETVWVDSKTATQFTVKSSVTSDASVDWFVRYN
ncbi:hypothetical protein ABI59_03680 [Acidobacteria bacterium Mor1]|nr:hypothetical protein ABI59_03680 [Acidobacteria bacterium Mor1]